MIRENLKLFLSLLSFLFTISCNEMFVNPSSEDNNIEDFEAAWKRVDEVYPYLEYKNINWDSLYIVYRDRAEKIQGDEIYHLLVDMLGELKDRHVYVKTDGGEYIPTFSPPRWLKDKYSYSPVVVRNYFQQGLKITGEGHIEYGIADGEIGYIYIGTFDGNYVGKYFARALDHVRDTRSLIIDIRHNNGGTYQNLVTVVSRFISSPLAKPEYYVLGKQVMLDPFVPEGDYQYLKPVVVLINGVCYSTGDIFPEVMKQIATVTVIGTTSSGGSSGSTTQAPAEFELPSSKKIFVGTTDWRAYNGLPLEWVGCSPDITVEQTAMDIENGRDKQLEYAFEYLK